jgi:hypothetical protein
MAAITYNGSLFGTDYKKATIRLPQSPGSRGQPLSQKIEIGSEVRWSNCLLEVVVPRKFDSLEDFFKVMLTPGENGFELVLTVDAETLEGEKLPQEPIYLPGNLSQILEDAANRWETLLMHPQNLNDQERHGLVKALLDAVKTYYQHLNKPQC